MLQPLTFLHTDPDLLIGLHTADDAAVYRISPDRAIVQTVDFFPPVVDDAFDFGRVAAANALSDIFAMGGDVLFALNIAAFPDTLPLTLLQRIFEGGQDVVRAAGGTVAGGHTVTDREPKYGLSVTGMVDPERILRKGGARPGDRLILTKALGTGVVTTALRADAATETHVQAAIASMTLLNMEASRAARRVEAHACTDVTGFGLLGHAAEMAQASGVCLRLSLQRFPLLPGAIDYARAGFTPAGLDRNRDYFEPVVRSEDALDSVLLDLFYDPETSGGLLVAVAPEQVAEFIAGCAGQPVWDVGVVAEGRGILLEP